MGGGAMTKGYTVEEGVFYYLGEQMENCAHRSCVGCI